MTGSEDSEKDVSVEDEWNVEDWVAMYLTYTADEYEEGQADG